MGDNTWLSFYVTEDHPTQAIPQGIEQGLKKAALSIHDLTDICYCRGPGSTLGTRLTEMTVRGLQSTLAQLQGVNYHPYNSLVLGARMLESFEKEAYCILAPTTDKKWYLLKPSSPEAPPVWETISNLDPILKTSSNVYYLPVRKVSPLLAQSAKAIHYNLHDVPTLFTSKASFWMPPVSSSPSSYYAPWTPQRHK